MGDRPSAPRGRLMQRKRWRGCAGRAVAAAPHCRGTSGTTAASSERRIALFDVLLGGAAPLVVEPHHPVRLHRQVGDDEADTREQFARMPFDLGDHRRSPAEDAA